MPRTAVSAPRTAVSGSRFSTSKANKKAFLFNGTSYWHFGDNFDLRTNDKTLCARVMFPKLPTAIAMVMGKTNSTSIDGRFGLGVNTNGTLFGQYDPGTAITLSGATALVPGRWYDIMLELDRDGNMTVYLDGVADGSASIAASSGTDWNTSINFAIGSSNGASYFEGYVEDPVWYDRLLSAAEKAVYFSGGIPDDYEDRADFSNEGKASGFTTANAVSGTFAGVQNWINTSHLGSVRLPATPFIRLNKESATSEYIALPADEVPTSLPAPPFTLEVLCRLESPTGNQAIWSHGNTSTGAGFNIYQTGVAGQVVFIFRGTSGASANKTTATLNKARPGELFLFSAVVSADTISLYVDGVFDSSTSHALTGSIYRASAEMRFGNFSYANAYANISIMEARIWSDVRTQAEIIAGLQRGSIPSDADDLYDIWRFSEGTGLVTTSDVLGLEADLTNVSSNYWLGARSLVS